MVGNCVDMNLPGVIIELLESVYQRHSSSLHVKNDESFQKRQIHQFSVISMAVMSGLRIFNSSSDKFLEERFLTTSSCVKGLLLFFVKFRNFFSWILI